MSDEPEGATTDADRFVAHLAEVERQLADWIASEQQLQSIGDRALVIVGCALIDDMLKRLVERRVELTTGFNGLGRKLRDALKSITDPMKVCGSFGARMQVAYIAGFIDAETLAALDVLRQVRNVFAHEVHAHEIDTATFTKGGKTKRVRPLVDDFCTRAETIMLLDLGEDKMRTATARDRFIHALGLMLVFLTQPVADAAVMMGTD